MATYKIFDRADEFRVDIAGRFAGPCVDELRSAWQQALRKALSRRFTVNLTRLSGYDADGRKLLRDMHLHGMQFAAGTPESLVFLREISTPLRRGAALLQDVSAHRKEPDKKSPAQASSKAASR